MLTKIRVLCIMLHLLWQMEKNRNADSLFVIKLKHKYIKNNSSLHTFFCAKATLIFTIKSSVSCMNNWKISDIFTKPLHSCMYKRTLQQIWWFSMPITMLAGRDWYTHWCSKLTYSFKQLWTHSQNSDTKFV